MGDTGMNPVRQTRASAEGTEQRWTSGDNGSC